MLTQNIETLFNRYLAAFKSYDLEKVKACYHFPCTLNTPDKILLLINEHEIAAEFNNIFIQLQAANTTNIIPKKASYTQLHDNLVLVCIDWDFIDDKQEIFADFSAIYHLLIIEEDIKIFNVVSHELTNSLVLATPFELEE